MAKADQNKLGFTFYVNDWWTSDTFIDFTPIQRYIYLEMLFMMYKNNGYITYTKTQIETRLRTKIETCDYEIVISKLTYTELGYTSKTVTKRMLKPNASAENGRKGGRPPKPKNNLTNNLNENLTITQNNLPLEEEREIKEKLTIIEKEYVSTPPPQIYSIEHLDVKECRIRYDELYQASKEHICIKSMGVIKITQIEKVQNTFDSFLISQGQTHKTLPDYAKHFGNWVSKKSKEDLKNIINQKIIDPTKPIESDYDRIMRERNETRR